MNTRQPMAAVAKAINDHLNRFASTPGTATRTWTDGAGRQRESTLFWRPVSWRAGNRVGVRYVNYHNTTKLTRDEAERYLAWLDAGNVGQHYEALKSEPASGPAP